MWSEDQQWTWCFGSMVVAVVPCRLHVTSNRVPNKCLYPPSYHRSTPSWIENYHILPHFISPLGPPLRHLAYVLAKKHSVFQSKVISPLTMTDATTWTDNMARPYSSMLIDIHRAKAKNKQLTSTPLYYKELNVCMSILLDIDGKP